MKTRYLALIIALAFIDLPVVGSSHLFAAELEADPVPRIIVFGDSWAKPLARALREVLTDNGHSDITVVTTPLALRASYLSLGGTWGAWNSSHRGLISHPMRTSST